MTNAIVINSTSIQPIEINGSRVITFSMIDEIHQRPTGTARKRFNDNKERLTEGEDYMKVCASEIRTHKIMTISNKATEDVTLITESGYLLLVKSFTDDLAWQIQKQLINAYFKVVPRVQVDTTPEIITPSERKTKQVLIGGQTADQQDAIKALVKARAEVLPQDKRAKATITMWSAVKSKYGKTYKAVPPEEFTNVLSLIARVPLEGEFIAAGTEAPKALPADKVLVSREYLTGLINMVELQRERFYLVEQAEEQIQYAFNMLSVMVSGQMKQANDAVREARKYMHDPLTHAKSYANVLKGELA